MALEFLVTDQLGTPRMVFDKSGSLAATKRHDYLPFGEELYATQGVRTSALGYSADNIRQKFTSYERDNETGLDYAQARYYANTTGRFTGPDPLMASAKATDPQTWNRYAYVGNNPMTFADPSGMARGPGSFYRNNPDISHAQNVGRSEVEAAESFNEDQLAESYNDIYEDVNPMGGALCALASEEQWWPRWRQNPRMAIRLRKTA